MAEKDFLDFGIEATEELNKTAVDSLFGGDVDDLEKLDPEKEKQKEAEKKAAEAKAKAAEKKTEDKKVEETKEEVDAVDALFGEEKKEEEKKTEDKEEEGKEEDKEEEGEFNQFEALSKELYGMGVFAGEQDEQGNESVTLAKTPEEFKELFEVQMGNGMRKQLQNFLVNKHGDSGLEAFEAIYVNGVDPREYFSVSTEIEDLENINIEDEIAQESIVREFYRRNNIPEDKIDKKIKTLKDTANLQSDAEDLLPQLIEQNKQILRDKEEAQKAKIQKELQKDTLYKNSVTKVLQEKLKEKEFDGLPVNDNTARQAFDFLYNKKWVAPNGEKLTDFDVFILESMKPENIGDRIKIALLKQNNFDFSKIEKKAASKQAVKYFSSFAEKKTGEKKTVAEKESVWPL